MKTAHPRLVEILDAIDASLPPATDPGVSYDNARRRAAAIRAAIPVETDPAVVDGLRRAAERADYVGD